MISFYSKRNSVPNPPFMHGEISGIQTESTTDLRAHSLFKFNEPPGSLKRNLPNKKLNQSMSSLQILDSTLDNTKLSHRDAKDNSYARFAPQSQSIMNLLHLDHLQKPPKPYHKKVNEPRQIRRLDAACILDEARSYWHTDKKRVSMYASTDMHNRHLPI
jgi:hypothetical protein